ncbi:MAG: dockerin type I repeat-containing protein, partial [Muribaculaceae bacterium]|nr:dockerin type I repeat-containing protein [Muribaculaceae bacterium]
MKKITTLLLSCLMALTAFNASAVNASIYEIDEGSLVGDVNNDNAVNVSDVTEIVNMILGIIPKNMESADIDNNGQVNVSDVTALINIILGTTTGGTTGGSVITMADFTPNSGTTSGSTPLHQWAEGDVIFLAIDPDYTSACQNVYAIERTGGKWVFRDVNGSNKVGFKTSGGTLCAAYVQHAD